MLFDFLVPGKAKTNKHMVLSCFSSQKPKNPRAFFGFPTPSDSKTKKAHVFLVLTQKNPKNLEKTENSKTNALPASMVLFFFWLFCFFDFLVSSLLGDTWGTKKPKNQKTKKPKPWSPGGHLLGFFLFSRCFCFVLFGQNQKTLFLFSSPTQGKNQKTEVVSFWFFPKTKKTMVFLVFRPPQT